MRTLVLGAITALAAATVLAAEEAAERAVDAAPARQAEAGTGTGTGAEAEAAAAACPPGFGCVTHLPLPRFVSLKGEEGNARRGPGLTHRIDWIFTRPGMPLKITAEYDNWRRVEDQDGAGGWVHYALLSGVRTALVTLDMAELHIAPGRESRVVAQAELGVVARLLECRPAWCRISADGEKGWIEAGALWGILPDEIIN